MLIYKSIDHPPPGRQKPAILVELPRLTDFVRSHYGPLSGRNVQFSGLRRLFAQNQDFDILFFDLFASGYDALALIKILKRLSFRGQVVALTPNLPDQDMVLRELAAAGEGLRIHILAPNCIMSA